MLIKRIRSADFRNNLSDKLEEITHNQNMAFEIAVYRRTIAYLVTPEDFLFLKRMKEEMNEQIEVSQVPAQNY